MANFQRNLTSILHLILSLLVLTGCSSRSTPVSITTYPMEVEAASATPTHRPTKVLPPTATPTKQKPTPTETVTPTAVLPTETPEPLPPLDIRTQLNDLPAGQYLVYRSFSDPYCGLKAVSTMKKVYELVNFSCHGVSPTGHYAGVDEISANALYLLLPEGNSLYLYHLKDHQKELLTPSQREDCGITSISWDGTKFAGICGEFGFGQSTPLAVRTIDQDWTIVQPFGPDDRSSVSFPTSWSSDGKKLAFQGETGVYVINDIDQCLKDPSNCPALITGPYGKKSANYITLSPDGKQLAVTLSWAIQVYNVETKESRIIADSGAMGLLLHGAAWSLDGKWIGYARDLDQTSGTKSNGYIVSLEDSTTYFLTGTDVHQIAGWLSIEP